MKTKVINAVDGEYCDRCEKNPLVIAIKGMRADLEGCIKADGLSQEAAVSQVLLGIAAAISKSYDCLGQAVDKREKEIVAGHIEKKRQPAVVLRHIEVESGAVAVGSNVQVVSSRKPGARKARREGTSSKYFGVTFNKNSGKWTSQICRTGKRWHGGYHDIEEDAAIEIQEHLGNTAEAARIRSVRDNKKPKQSPLTAEEKEISKEIDKAKGDFTWQWSCKDCGTFVEATTNRCPKCNGGVIEKIKVLNDPDNQLGKSAGRHN